MHASVASVALRTACTTFFLLAWARDHHLLLLFFATTPKRRASQKHRCVSLRPPSDGTPHCSTVLGLSQAMTIAMVTPHPNDMTLTCCHVHVRFPSMGQSTSFSFVFSCRSCVVAQQNWNLGSCTPQSLALVFASCRSLAIDFTKQVC